MNDLRQQLEAARSEYEATRYPGKLAADMLRPQTRPQTHIAKRLFITVAAMGAIAAAVALWMSIQPLGVSTSPKLATVTTPIAATTTNANEEFSISVPEVPTFPEGIQLMPTGESFALPSVPSFPTLEELERDAASSTATTKEAVL